MLTQPSSIRQGRWRQVRAGGSRALEVVTGGQPGGMPLLFHNGSPTAAVSGWGFSLEGTSCPVAVWHGSRDKMVPFAHGQWLAAHIPTAVPRLCPGEGHLSLAVTRIGDILSDLAALASP